MENMQDFIPKISASMSKKEVMELNPLTLAFVGDAVQSLVLKTNLAFNDKHKVNFLQKEISKKVNATSQSIFIKKILEKLTEDELYIFKRARNTKVHTIAKNSNLSDYKMATGFEAIIGYLYLIGDNDRLTYILSLDED